MVHVTKESLAARIAELESGARSLKEDYTLAAYKMLLATMEAEPVYQILIYGAWVDTDEGEFNCSDTEDRRILYKTRRPLPIVPGKWIPVSERMPDDNADQQVLACFKGGDISALYYSEGRWDDAYGIVPIRQDVTHWMPLPAGPVK